MTESEKMEKKKLYQEGVSISELSRRLGYDRKTIRKAIRSQEVGNKLNQGEQRKTSKLDPFKPYIEQRMRSGLINFQAPCGDKYEMVHRLDSCKMAMDRRHLTDAIM